MMNGNEQGHGPRWRQQNTCKFEGEDGDNGTHTSSKGKMETTEHAQVQRGRQGQQNMRKFEGDQPCLSTLWW